MFDEKTAERLEVDNKVVKEEKPAVPRFLFDRNGEPRRNEDYRRQFQRSRPKTFIPPTDVPQEKVDKVHQSERGQKAKMEIVGERDNISKEEKGLHNIS